MTKCKKCKLKMCHAFTHNGWFCSTCDILYVKTGGKWKPMIRGKDKKWIAQKKRKNGPKRIS